jgi:hypothetical protein
LFFFCFFFRRGNIVNICDEIWKCHYWRTIKE